MKKPKRYADCLISLFLTAVFLFTVFFSALPAASAASSDEIALTAQADDNAEVAASHRAISFDDIPVTYDAAIDCGVSLLKLSAKNAYLDINERYQLNVLDAYSHTVNGRVSFSVSDPAVAAVSESGVITAKGRGEAVITAEDRASGAVLSCNVYVGDAYAPTQPPIVTPTDEPSEAPEPTQAPTAAPTSAPTQAPTQSPTQAPTQPVTQAATVPPSAETLSLNAASATVYKGCYYHVVATSNTTVSFSSSNTSVATVDNSGVVTALSAGSVTITARTSTKSATCKLNVISGSSVNLSHTSASVNSLMTFMLTSSTSGVRWTSSDTSVATVYSDGNYGYVLGVKAGIAVITVSTSKGAATCLMTVLQARPVRFAYTSPNCAPKNKTVELICITDTLRTGVRFAVNMGSEIRYVNAASYVKDADTYVWKGTTSFSAAGTYTVTAYSQLGSGSSWTTCADGATDVFVTDTTDTTTTICANRRASDELIRLISTFEGLCSAVYLDPFTGDPTLGYGVLVFPGQQFYNNLTKNEAYAYLVQNVNGGGYTKNINSFLVSNKVKFNQQQFDALVCFAYNCGTGPFYSDDDLIGAILNCSDGTGSSKSYYINGSYVRIRKGAGTSYDIIKELSYGTALTILSTANSSWYYVQLSDGTKGYVSSDYISYRTTGGNLDLRYVNKQDFIDNLCQYHHAGGDCVYGLLYRRVDETEMFFYGDYEADYGYYKYSIKFTCARNSSFHT